MITHSGVLEVQFQSFSNSM